MALISKFRASMSSVLRHNRKYEGFVTLLFIKVEEQKVADRGILICTFQKSIYF